MGRRLIAVAAFAVMAATLLPTQAAGPTGVACVISGTANLSPAITTKGQAASYTFTGNLTNCKSTDKSIKTGTVSASGAGKLSCVNGSSNGSGTVQWNNGQSSTITFNTKDAASAVVVQGKVVSGEFAGTKTTQGIAGLLNFITTQAAACTKAGLTTLNFKGAVGAGSAN